MPSSHNKLQLSQQARAEIDHWLEKYPADKRRSAVIQALMIVQDEHGGWLTNELMDAVGDYLGLPYIAVYEVATFYSMFELEQVGRYKISVCNNISCMLCGGDEVLDHVKRRLGIKVGQTTADRRFTIKAEEECMAACTAAPMMVINGHYYEHLTADKVDAILDGLE
ncbi:MAG: NADH-quinone oxidoreductase subunit NuoE [Gammaproteobacteria bacterium]|nr:NADH-quinone oxidoreductase subunit NuoE [Gammaproteobacteria bacterium]